MGRSDGWEYLHREASIETFCLFFLFFGGVFNPLLFLRTFLSINRLQTLLQNEFFQALLFCRKCFVPYFGTPVYLGHTHALWCSALSSVAPSFCRMLLGFQNRWADQASAESPRAYWTDAGEEESETDSASDSDSDGDIAKTGWSPPKFPLPVERCCQVWFALNTTRYACLASTICIVPIFLISTAHFGVRSELSKLSSLGLPQSSLSAVGFKPKK